MCNVRICDGCETAECNDSHNSTDDVHPCPDPCSLDQHKPVKLMSILNWPTALYHLQIIYKNITCCY